MDLVIFNKAAAFCAYQERTHHEVRERLRKWQVWGEAADEIIAELIVRNFLSEERFAKSFAGGKHRVKQWGRIKIRQELQRRGVGTYSISEGMRELDETAYREGLQKLLEKKAGQLSRTEPDRRMLQMKLMRYAIGKGYEPDLVRQFSEKIMADK
ncbi:regulatory protein RecX [Ravibacter arvi]|uniref:Regulatory protein RecX n=1 Tax=Ravibacter arvi TaxID=2051041 RepID=A0ABP8LZQ9_9BACT